MGFYASAPQHQRLRLLEHFAPPIAAANVRPEQRLGGAVLGRELLGRPRGLRVGVGGERRREGVAVGALQQVEHGLRAVGGGGVVERGEAALVARAEAEAGAVERAQLLPAAGGGELEQQPPLLAAPLLLGGAQEQAALGVGGEGERRAAARRPRAVSIGVQPSVSSVWVTGKLSAPTARKSGVHPELVVAETLCSAPSSPPIRSNWRSSGGDGASAARWMSWRPSALTAGSARASSSARAAAARPPITASCSAVYGGFFTAAAPSTSTPARSSWSTTSLSPRRAAHSSAPRPAASRCAGDADARRSEATTSDAAGPEPQRPASTSAASSARCASRRRHVAIAARFHTASSATDSGSITSRSGRASGAPSTITTRSPRDSFATASGCRTRVTACVASSSSKARPSFAGPTGPRTTRILTVGWDCSSHNNGTSSSSQSTIFADLSASFRRTATRSARAGSRAWIEFLEATIAARR